MRRITRFIFVLVAGGGFAIGGFCAAAAATCSAPRCGAFAAHPASAEPLAKPGRAALQQTPPHITDPLPPRALISSARVPFVANDGQIADPGIKYYARTFGGTVYALSDGKIVYSLPKYDAASRTGARSSSGSVILREILCGSFEAEPLGAGKSRVAVNSFIGSRPEKWRTNLPAFDRLDFGEVYEGVSLLLCAHGNNVEKVFVISPGADPREIAFRYEGADDIEITADGKLELQTALGAVRFTRPVAWQIDNTGARHSIYENFPPQADPPAEDNVTISERFVIPAKAGIQERELLDSRLHGNDRECGALHPDKSCKSSAPLRQEQATLVDVSYVLAEDGTIRFELGAYDPNKILVIDPLLASTFIGGGGADAVQAMAVNSQTNVYVAGYTDSSDFPVTSGSLAGGQDAFVSKFDANLGSLIASTYLGGSSNDQAFALGIDADSRVWLAGYTESIDFPAYSLPMSTTNNGSRDAFVAILSADLALSQATYLGGSNADCAAAIAMDNLSRQQYIVGYTDSANFPATNSTGYRTNYNGARDAFVVLFSNSVSRADYKTGIFLGGTNADEAAAVALTPGSLTNYLYVVGFTSSTNFPGTNGFQRIYGGGTNDAFVSRLSALLTNLPSSTFLGGTGSDVAYAVALDVSNRVYVAGWTYSTNFPQNPTNNIYLAGWTNAYRGGQDIFLTCLTNNLTNLYVSTYIGGTGDDVARCLVVDSSSATNLVYLAGYTASSDFPTTPNAYDRSYNGGYDAWTLRMDGRLTNLYASTYLGGAADDQALALALAPDSNTLFVAGITASSDFPASDAAYENIYRGGANDGFATRFPASLAYGTMKWKKFVGWYCSSPALAWDGTVLIGNETSLYAFTRSGAERWQVPTTSAVASQSPTDYAGIGVPAVGTNNVIYINTYLGIVFSISSAGAVNWTFRSGALEEFWSSIAFGNGGKIFFGKSSTFYALNQNGIGLWTNSMVNESWSSPAISSNGTIYTANYNGPKLYAFDQNSSTSHVWEMGGAGGFMYSSPALDTNGTIYASARNLLYAFNPDGTTARTWTAGSGVRSWSSPAISSNGVVYVGGGNDLYGFNPADGTTVKVWRAGGEVKSSPAIAADGSIIVGATNGLYSFNPDGTTNWFFAPDDIVHFHAPLIDSEGTIYLSDDGLVYAIYGSQPPAESGWPMFRHDALRTGNQGMNASALLRPSGLSVSKGAFTNYVRVGWNAFPNALSYELWRSLTNSTDTAGRIKRSAQTNYNDSSIEPGKIYYYWVKVKTPIALGVFSASDLGGVPPFPPAGVTASDGVPTNYVQLSWLSSTNASLYYVYRSLSSATNTAVIIGQTAATNYDDWTVAPGLTHYYWVKAGNLVAGVSGFSSSDSGGIPAWPPSGFSASQGAYIHSVALSWNSSTGASSYLVYRHTEDSSGAAALLQETGDTSTSINDASVTPLRRYYYWLRATNTFGLSGFNASALGWGLLAPPQTVSASAGTYSNMIRVSWIVGSTDATAHVIFRSLSSDSSTAARQSEVVRNDATATNYDDTAIIRGPDYYYWVAAKNNYGSSSWTAASAPGGTIPATPADLNASDGQFSNMVEVTWSSCPGASFYPVYRYETFDSAYATQIGSALTNYFEDNSALHGVLYYYWVKAGNNHGVSALSAFNSGWRAMAPPDSVTAGNGVSTSEVSVTWSAAPNATVYELWRGTSSNSVSASRLANNIAVVSYSDSSANPGTVYYYWLKSKRGTYISAFSASDYGYRAIGLLDIGVSDFVFVPAIFGPLAHPSAVSFKVSNLSALDMNDPNDTVQYDLYLSQNVVFGDGDDRWIGGSDSTLPLNAGASTRVVSPASVRTSITIPDWPSGRYYVFVFANHCLPSAWLDPNLVNNAALRIGDSILITTATASQPVWSDFDGDGKSDLALYHEAPSASSGQAGGAWRIWLSTSDYAQTDLAGLGGAGYRAIPRDYDGDGKVDPAVYNEVTPSAGSGQAGEWRVCLSASGYQTVSVTGMGGTAQYPVPGDYDGDGKVDPAVYQPAPSAGSGQAGGWRVWLSTSGYAEAQLTGIGGVGWQAESADYDGDAKTDPAVYQESTGTWRVWLSGDSYRESSVAGWGGAGQHPVPADYDGDGKVDPAVYESATGTWRVWASSDSYRESGAGGWGGSGQTAVPGDYDGDGRVDAVVYWESMGMWRLWLSSYGYSEMDILISGGFGFQAITAEEM